MKGAPQNEHDLRLSGFIQGLDGVWRKAKHPADRDNRGPCAELQELQKVNSGQEHRKAADAHPRQDKEANATAGRGYSVRFVFRVSDKRRRDGFGMSETAADCLIRAIRRFVRGDTAKQFRR